ncbi:MAG: flagellar hook-length control protein FliK [Caulobacter sp.]
MTVPAFSPSVVLPGAPSAPAGRGASGAGGGLFEGLLAGQVDEAVVGAVAGKSRPAPGAVDVDPADEADAQTAAAAQDAGLALLLAGPGAAPALTPTPKETGESDDAAGLAARQIRIPAPLLARPSPLSADPDAVLAEVSGEPSEARGQVTASDPAPLPPVKAIADRPGQTVPVVDAKAAPVAPAPPQPVAADLAKAAPPPAPPVTPPVAIPAAAAAAAAQVADPAAQTEAPRPAATIGDLRRAAVARGDRRAAPAVGAAATALAGESPVKQAALAALENSLTADAADATPAAEPEPVAADAVETTDAQQPNLPGEARAVSGQAAAAEAAAVVPRGSPETVAKMAADIIRKLDGQSTRFDLELNPHGMGKVDVAIEIDRAGRLTAAMTFDTAQSAADLRGRSAELRQALEQAGFSVSDGGLTFDTAGQNPGFGGRGAAQHHQDRAWHGRAFQRAQSGADEADLSRAGAPSPSASRTRSGVDIRI